MKKGLYPGSFDPVTNGHLDMIERGSKMFDTLYVAVVKNESKKCLFSVEERKTMLEEVCKNYKNVEVVISEARLTVDIAKELNVDVILRGLRAVTDFEYEIQMASTNSQLNDDIETIFMMTNIKYSFLSSSIVKEVASLGGDVSKFVPKYICEKLEEKNIK